MIDAILEAIKTSLQAEKRLSEVTTYHIVDGMMPGTKTSVSIGCSKISYEDYDASQDEAHASIRVYVYLQDMQAERGEKSVRRLSKDIRLALLGSDNLKGLVDVLTITEISHDSDQVNQTQLLHFAMVDLYVKYYESRARPDGDLYPAEKINADFNNEKIEINL